MTVCLRPGLYAVTDVKPGQHPEELFAAARGVLAGGSVVFQYRDKTSSPAQRRILAHGLLQLCRAHDVPLIINDDVSLAAEIDADGVHLGKDDASIDAAREQLGNKIIGVSCYNEFPRAVAAARAGADYVAFGRFFTSATKPSAVPADVALIEQAKAALSVPVVAIGGITIANAPALLDAGVDLIAVVQGVFGAEDPGMAARQFANLFENRGRTAAM